MNNNYPKWPEELGCSIHERLDEYCVECRICCIRNKTIQYCKLAFEEWEKGREIDEEKLAKAAYEEYMKQAGVDGIFERNLTDYGKKYWVSIAQSIKQAVENNELWK